MTKTVITALGMCLVFLQSVSPSFSADQPQPPRLEITFPQLAGLFSTKDAKLATLRLQGAPTDCDEAVVHLTCTDAYGRSRKTSPNRIVLKRSKGFARKLELESEIGYYTVSYRVAITGDGTEKDAAQGSFVYAVIPFNPVVEKDPGSPFGTCTHFNQGWPVEAAKLIKKAGIAWIYNDINTMPDVVVPIAKENNLCYLPVFTWYRVPDKKHMDKDGNWDFSEVAEMCGRYAAQYGQDIDCYDLVNEPSSPWGAEFGGSWDGGAWQIPFVKFGRQVSQAIKKADPGANIVWQDIDVFLWWKQFYDLGAAESIDVMAPHPYNMHRDNPYPEDQPMLKQLAGFHRLVREQKLSWQVWSDEVGYSSFRLAETTPGHFYTPCTELEQAGLLVRMMVLQLSHGVDKVFWYDFRNDGTEPTHPENNFGLIRYDNSPKPALVAYANLINHLRQARWLGRYDIGNGAFAYAFVDRAQKPKLVAWVKQGSATVNLRVPSRVTKVRLTDIFGTTTTDRVRDHQFSLNLSETPVYVEGLKMQDVRPFVQEPAAINP